ncbi:MAG: hypothetical protein KC684_04485, partial [Candidatus Omnitrophica bacterium]|nr:hypothetical protein [Candidatus Omnitrophota bacterium]
TGVLGVSLFSFVAAAYITTFLKTYIYQTGTKLSQFFLVMIVVVINGLLEYLLYMKYTDIHFFDVVKYVLTPDVLTTTIVSVYTFRQLKSCVLKLSA